MRSLCVPRVLSLKGEIALLGDKSIAHRCMIVSSLAQGKTTLENFPTNEDCLFTIAVFKKLGIKIKQERLGIAPRPIITVFAKGLAGLKKPQGPIFVGDSGTTLRLILGVLAGQDFQTKLVAGKSLSRRPMLRVTKPLRLMGAKINAIRNTQYAIQQEEYPPITISGGNLRPITYKMPVASAQVKSAILLAGLYVKGATEIIEPISTRDHTERILKLFRADIKVNPSTRLRIDGERSRTIKANKIVIKGDRELVSPGKIYIPGDISSASFFMVAAAILPNSRIGIKNVSLNPSRIGVIRVLKRMGARIKVQGSRLKAQGYEPMGSLVVKSSFLKGTRVKREEIPSLIDELPILMVAACVANGRTIFEGIGELRVKETDRIRSMSENLSKMGAHIKVLKDDKSENIIIRGVKQFKGTRVRSFGDHRTAMSMVVAGLGAKGKTSIDDISCIDKSFPDFTRLLKTLMSRRLTERK